MRRRPISLFICSLMFLYFPVEFCSRALSNQGNFSGIDLCLSVIVPIILLFGLIRVSRMGWYTLVALVALWGFRDLHTYYDGRGASLWPLLAHILIYVVSLVYFINPRIRHLYFDPKMRWWRIKRRYETHLPFIMNQAEHWHYPILRNISEGGCFIETAHLLDMNSLIEIAIPLPVPLGVPVIRTQGEVRWVSKNPLRHGMGVQFRAPLPEHQRAIKEYVRKHVLT